MHHQPAHIQWIHLLQSDVMDQTITAIYPLHRLGNPHHRRETHFERIDPCDILHHRARSLRRQWLSKRDQRIHLIARRRGGKTVLCPLHIIRQGFVIIPPQLIPHQPGRWRMVLPPAVAVINTTSAATLIAAMINRHRSITSKSRKNHTDKIVRQFPCRFLLLGAQHFQGMPQVWRVW